MTQKLLKSDFFSDWACNTTVEVVKRPRIQTHTSKYELVIISKDYEKNQRPSTERGRISLQGK